MTRECQCCGQCCRRLLIECGWHDGLREPKLLEPAVNPHGLTAADLEDGLKCVILHECAFLGADNLCTIYPTRPNVCVGFEPDGKQCRQIRKECRS